MAATEYDLITAKQSIVAAAALSIAVKEEVEDESELDNLVKDLAEKVDCSRSEILSYMSHLEYFMEQLIPSYENFKEVPLPSFSSISCQPCVAESHSAIAA